MKILDFWVLRQMRSYDRERDILEVGLGLNDGFRLGSLLITLHYNVIIVFLLSWINVPRDNFEVKYSLVMN